MPAVVRAGIVETASHIDRTWIGVDAVDYFSKEPDGRSPC